LDAGAQSRAQVLAGFSESTENQIALIGSMQNGIEYIPV
jgi:serralysin